jgi:hypothetical protein
MSADPATTGCAPGYPGNKSNSVLIFDAVDGACEANPPIQPPVVATLPNLPVYPTTVCDVAGITGGLYGPGEYKCANGPALTISTTGLKHGIYEIDKGNNGACDVVMTGGVTDLNYVTFYLKGGAGICMNPACGTTITSSPFVTPAGQPGAGDPGDGRYVVLSDNVANPSITMNTAGAGSCSGIWQVTGVIWLPSGSVFIGNKDELLDTGQIITNSWNDQSGNHTNPGVTYKPDFAPGQKEELRLAE